jgi:hypothetical protein
MPLLSLIDFVESSPLNHRRRSVGAEPRFVMEMPNVLSVDSMRPPRRTKGGPDGPVRPANISELPSTVYKEKQA